MRNVTKAIALMVILLGASQALAQQGSAELRGRLLDNTGGALPGVTVTVRNQASGVYRQSLSTTDGAYFMTGLIPGTYELTTEMSGFRKYSRKDCGSRWARPPPSTCASSSAASRKSWSSPPRPRSWT